VDNIGWLNTSPTAVQSMSVWLARPLWSTSLEGDGFELPVPGCWAPSASLLIRCYTERIPRGAQQGLFPRA